MAPRCPSHRRRLALASSTLAGAVAALAGCEREVAGSGPERRARPVTVLELRTTSPALHSRFTGLATPYRQEDVGFEVSGRVEMVRDVGMEFQGPVLDFAGDTIRPGDVIARLDPTRYQQRVRSVALRVASAQANLEAQEIELAQVASAQVQSALAQLAATREEIAAAAEDVKAARAAAVYARQEYERQKGLVDSGTASRQGLERAKSDLDGADARLAQARSAEQAKQKTLAVREAALAEARAGVKLKEAQIKATRAQIAELQEDQKSAQLDLEDCVLRAPYSGRITSHYTSRGGFVAAGAPVIELTLLDPMKVTVTVSAQDDRRIHVGSQAEIRAGADEPLIGSVMEKSEVADPATRTFSVNVITRNLRRLADRAADGALAIEGATPVVREFAGEAGPLFVDQRCLLQEGEATYVLRLPGIKFAARHVARAGGKLVPEKIQVEFDEQYLTFLDRRFRAEKGGELELGDLLVRFPRPEHLAQGVTLAGYDWLLRPGDLVPVGFDLGSAPAGFYVPVRAIRELNGETWVFLAEDGRAKKVPVQTHEAFRELRRITGEGLQDGAAVVVKGAHYVADGEPLSVLGAQG